MVDNELQTSQETQTDAGQTPSDAVEVQQNAGEQSDASIEALSQENDELRKKFSESSREAQVLYGKNKELENRLQGSKALNESQMREIYPDDWDAMTPTEQRLAKENEAMKRSLHEVHNLVGEMTFEKRLNGMTESLPGLKGREEEFKKFAQMPTHKGTPLDILAKAFLHDALPAKKVIRQNAGIDTGVSKEPSQSPIKRETFTDEEIADIQKKDPKRYTDLIRKGII